MHRSQRDGIFVCSCVLDSEFRAHLMLTRPIKPNTFNIARYSLEGRYRPRRDLCLQAGVPVQRVLDTITLSDTAWEKALSRRGAGEDRTDFQAADR